MPHRTQDAELADIYDRYLDQRQSIREIAADIDRPYSYVRDRLLDVNIELRPRGGPRAPARTDQRAPVDDHRSAGDSS